MRQKGRNKLDSRARSFQYAFAGISYVLRTQHNTWIHAAVTAGVFILALWLRLPLSDWAVLTVTVVLVWTAEIFNTAMEVMVDLLQPEHHPAAKVAKDVAAAAVLLSAIGAVLIGLLLLGPSLWERLTS